MPIFLKFWLKTVALYLPLPEPVNMRSWRKKKDPQYVHERDKHPVRQKHHGKGGWQTNQDSSIIYRDYADYDEYLTHQKTKWDEILKVKGGFEKKVILDYRIRFFSRFRFLSRLLKPDATILCLGARQGTEVEVLRDIGFPNAYGIDLNPGSDNHFVRKGDFMHLEEADQSLDLIYSNCVDHAFDLDGFFREQARKLKKNGLALYDLPLGDGKSVMGGPFESVSWEREEIIFQILLKYYQSILKVEKEPGWMWILLQGPQISSNP